MIKERDLVVLTDYVASGEDRELIPGDVGCVVQVHPGGTAYTVEFLSLQGVSVATAILQPSQVRAATHSDLTQSRPIPIGRSVHSGGF